MHKSPPTWRVAALAIACLALNQAAFAQSRITVQLDKPGHPVSPTLWGIFFEDINHSTDGGIYPELVRNRSFEDADQPEGWRISNSTGETAIDSSKPLNPFNRRSLLVKLNGSATIENDGYWGMNIVQGATYIFTVAARATEGFASPLAVRLLSATDVELAKGEVTGFAGDWKYYRLELTANGSDPKAHLQAQRLGPRHAALGHGVADAEGHVEIARPAPRPGGHARRSEALVHALPGRLLGRRRRHGAHESLEADHRRH